MVSAPRSLPGTIAGNPRVGGLQPPAANHGAHACDSWRERPVGAAGQRQIDRRANSRRKAGHDSERRPYFLDRPTRSGASRRLGVSVRPGSLKPDGGSKHGKQESYSLRKRLLGSDQADNQMPLGREVVEVAGMDVDIFLLQQLDRKPFVGPRRRNAKK